MISAGRLLDRKYRLIAEVGRGGMSVVWSAHHVDLGRTVAVKFLRPGLAPEFDAVTRFGREARTLGSLPHHPNLVSVHDVGTELDDSVELRYIVMEYVEGSNLAECMTTDDVGGTERRLEILAGVAAALSALHLRGIVHRDVKPANILVSADGSVKLTDFGIALSEEHGSDRLTRSRLVIATPPYMSPEQATGHPGGPQSDLYSLCVVAYQLLSGNLPYTGAPFARGRLDPEPLPRHVPRRVAAIVEGTLSVTRPHRPDDADTLLRALTEAPSESETTPQPSPELPTAIAPAPDDTTVVPCRPPSLTQLWRDACRDYSPAALLLRVGIELHHGNPLAVAALLVAGAVTGVCVGLLAFVLTTIVVTS